MFKKLTSENVFEVSIKKISDFIRLNSFSLFTQRKMSRISADFLMSMLLKC